MAIARSVALARPAGTAGATDDEHVPATLAPGKPTSS
jgi:hypothetical protein